MKVLYIHRKMYDDSGWFNKRFKHLGQKLKRRYLFEGRYSFFRGSVHRGMNTTEKSFDYLKSVNPRTVDDNYDWLIVSHEANSTDEEPESFSELGRSVGRFSTPKALFVGHPHPSYLPPDEFLYEFDLVFKREPYADRSRYSRSENNVKKIRPTVLNCPILTPNFLSLNWIDPTDYGYDSPASDPDRDVYFNGRDCNKHRRNIWSAVREMNLSAGGGLYEGSSDFSELPENLKGEKLEMGEYENQIHNSRINLALEGAGPFTHRHWEIWACSSFLLSNPGIKDLSLPFAVEEGKHYISFDSQEDLESKIHYYLEHCDERLRITQKGRELYEEEYDFTKHGDFVKEQLIHSST